MLGMSTNMAAYQRFQRAKNSNKKCVEQVIVEHQILLVVQGFEHWLSITSWRKKRNEVSIV